MPRLSEWERLEEDTLRALILADPTALKTQGSGRVKGDGDVISRRFLAECKYRTKDNVTVDRKWLTRLRKQANDLDRFPLVVTRNQHNETYVTLAFNDFTTLLSEGRPAPERSDDRLH